MRILALDIATVTGWAMGGDRSAPTFGTWKLPGVSLEKRSKSAAAIYGFVMATVREHKIEGVAIEAPIMLTRGQSSGHTMMGLIMLSGAAQAGAVNGGAEVLDMPTPQQWRAQVLGKGRLENPKRAALDYCAMHGWNTVDHNAAEALCIWQWAHGQTSLLDRIVGGAG